MKQPVNRAALRKAGGKPANQKMPASGPIKRARKPRSSAIDGPSTADEHRWKVEDATRVLMRAEELRKDKRLMSDVKRYADEQAAKMKTICKS